MPKYSVLFKGWKTPIFPWWENNSKWFCCFLGWTPCRLHVWMITLLHVKGRCFLSSSRAVRGCWEPALLWDVFKQPAPKTAHVINITRTGEVQHKQSSETSEMEFKGGRWKESLWFCPSQIPTVIKLPPIPRSCPWPSSAGSPHADSWCWGGGGATWQHCATEEHPRADRNSHLLL